MSKPSYLKQHLLRHDRESNKENLFCLECTNLPEGKKTWFEVEADYVAHVKEFHDESFKRSRSEESKSCYFHFPQVWTITLYTVIICHHLQNAPLTAAG